VDAVASVRKISNGNVPSNSSRWGARVDDRNMSGYFRRQVIAATSASDGAAVRPSSLHGSIPVSVRTILIRKLLAGWERKVVSRDGIRYSPQKAMTWSRRAYRAFCVLGINSATHISS